MTKEITKAVVLQQIQDKMKLREFTGAKFLFDETVIPVYDINQHFEEWWQKYETKGITSTGPQSFFIVPANEKWHVKRYDVVFMTGAFTIAGMYIKRINSDPAGGYCYLDLTAAQNVSYHQETDVVLSPGDLLYANVDGYTSPGDLRVYIDFKKETIR